MRKSYLYLAAIAFAAMMATGCSGSSGSEKPLEYYAAYEIDGELKWGGHITQTSRFYVKADGSFVNVDKLAVEEDDWVQLGPFYEGLAFAHNKMQNTCVIINTSGEQVGEIPSLDKDFSRGDIFCFSEGIAFISDNSEKRAIAFDKKGDQLFEIEGIPVTPYRNGVCLFKGSAGVGAIDTKGNVVLEPDENRTIFRSHSNFNFYAYSFEQGLIAFKEGDLYGFQNLEGKVVVEPVFEGEPMAVAPNRFVVYGKQTALYDDKGKNLTEDLDIYVHYDREVVPDGNLISFPTSEGRGWMDFDGKVVIEPIAGLGGCYLFNGSDRLAIACSEGNLLIDRKGKIVKELDFKPSEIHFKNSYIGWLDNRNCAVFDFDGKQLSKEFWINILKEKDPMLPLEQWGDSYNGRRFLGFYDWLFVKKKSK